MPARCCNPPPDGITSGDLAKRDQAVALIQECIDRVSQFGYVFHTTYSDQYFFVEKKAEHKP